MRPVGTPSPKKGQHEKFSPTGSMSGNSEIPTITPLLLLTGQATALFGPPESVPRGIAVPFTQRAATLLKLPGKLTTPVNGNRSVMAFGPPMLTQSASSAPTL